MYKRTQKNGPFNTRCLHCFFTVASAVNCEPELDCLEALHLCPEKALEELNAQKPEAVPALRQ
jgi:hypothetical protein